MRLVDTVENDKNREYAFGMLFSKTVFTNHLHYIYSHKIII